MKFRLATLAPCLGILCLIPKKGSLAEQSQSLYNCFLEDREREGAMEQVTDIDRRSTEGLVAQGGGWGWVSTNSLKLT